MKAKDTVRRQAKRLFFRLRKRSTLPNSEAIRVIYARRFPPGTCIIAVTIPIDKVPMRTVLRVCDAHRRYHYPPAIINGQGQSRSLRLIYRFPKISSVEELRLLQYSQMTAEWMEEIFGIPAIVSPVEGLVEARRKLQAFDVPR